MASGFFTVVVNLDYLLRVIYYYYYVNSGRKELRFYIIYLFKYNYMI